MIPLLTPLEMRDADATTIAAGTSEGELMARAGFAVARAARRMLGSTYGRRVVVLCGPGNNGGDGRIAAQVLRRWGVRAEVFAADAIGDARFVRALDRADLVIDALYGTGFRGVLDATIVDALARITELGTPVLAVDIPSGIDGLTGIAAGPHVVADVTVTFQAYKPGLCFGAGRTAAGGIEVVDLGIAVDGSRAAIVTGADVAAWLPERPLEAHKWMDALYVLGGSAGMTGAPMLVAHAAMRAGAGMVWCAMPGDAAARASGTEVITKSLPATAHDALDGAAVEPVLAAAKRFAAMVVGPGLGGDAATVRAVQQLVAEVPIPLVLDADGLNAIAGDLAPLRLRTAQGAVTVLTPHDGEYARLTGRTPDGDRIASARALAEATGAVVLLKGSTTTVAAPDGRVRLSLHGGPELASAGTGDALSGIIGAFLARGLDPLAAAAGGAYVHGAAGRRIGRGLVAFDLPAAIPPTLEALPETGA